MDKNISKPSDDKKDSEKDRISSTLFQDTLNDSSMSHLSKPAGGNYPYANLTIHDGCRVIAASNDVSKSQKEPNSNDLPDSIANKDSVFGDSKLLMFADLNHSDPSYRELLEKKVADWKKAGAKYLAVEGLPDDFKKEWLHDPQKLDELKKKLGPLDPDSTIGMLKAAVEAGLEPVGLEKSKMNGIDVTAYMHDVLKDDSGKRAFDDYAKNANAHKDSPEGKALHNALEKSMRAANRDWSPEKVKEEADKSMSEFDMLKDSHFDFSVVSKEADSLLAQEKVGAKFSDAIHDPVVLKAYSDYVSAKIAARDSGNGKAGDGSSKVADDSAALRASLKDHLSSDEIDKFMKDTDAAIGDKVDKIPLSKDIIGTISSFLSISLGKDKSADTMATLDKVGSEAVKRTLARLLSENSSAFEDKMNSIMQLDWRNRMMADKMSELVSKGKTVLIAGGAHLSDNEYDKGIPGKDLTDEFGFLPKTMLHYLRDDVGADKVGHPWLWIKDKRVDPRDDDAVDAAEQAAFSSK